MTEAELLDLAEIRGWKQNVIDQLSFWKDINGKLQAISFSGDNLERLNREDAKRRFAAKEDEW